MRVLRRFAQMSIWRPYRVRHARAIPPGWPNATAGLRPGINEVAASVRIAAPKRSNRVMYSLDLDIGEVALGHHLIVRSISLTDENLLFDYAFVPELTEEGRGEVGPNMNYGADVSPPGWNQACSEAEVYERPVPEARRAWFDFFRPDYDWLGHLDRRGQPHSDYLRNRIARFTFDLKTGEARIEK
jgi:hypothetical protein